MPLTTLRVDPFIEGIETVKHALACLDCLVVTGAEVKIVERPGTAFLISKRATF
jgi:hypothetical protein